MIEKYKSDIDSKNIAHLKDRILMYEGKRQTYGTQVVFYKEFLKYKLYKVNNPKELNNKRKEVGLESIEEYIDAFS